MLKDNCGNDLAYGAGVASYGGPYYYRFLDLNGTGSDVAVAGTGTLSLVARAPQSGTSVEGNWDAMIGINPSGFQGISVPVVLEVVDGSPTPLGIATSTLPMGTVNAAYSATVSVTGGFRLYNFTVTGLPSGLSVVNANDNATGTITITGTPATYGNYTVGITVIDSSGDQAGYANQSVSTTIPLTICRMQGGTLVCPLKL
jgi:hypothetical protein